VVNWKAKPATNLYDRTVVIVDDILDEGVTLAAVMDYCRSCKAKEIFTAVLLDKKKERSPGGVEDADFKGLKIDNHFVFGYGLDYKNYLRNAPGIYIVAPEHLDH
jgi:hypoxanthine phosphoribosyltransferase